MLSLNFAAARWQSHFRIKNTAPNTCSIGFESINLGAPPIILAEAIILKKSSFAKNQIKK